MFKRSTVFILGAGASWHYGYPTGEDLVNKVIDAADRFANFFGEAESLGSQLYPKFVSLNKPDLSSTPALRFPWQKAKEKCQELARRLRTVSPLVIDYFLGQNPSLQEVGKLLICWVIMASEEKYLRIGGNQNRQEVYEQSPLKRGREDALGIGMKNYKDNWYRFILHKVVGGCVAADDLLQNKVSFVTFNYDVSLEYALYTGLKSIDVFNEQVIQKFLSEDRLIHCYGKIRNTISPPQRKIFFKDFFDRSPQPSGTRPNEPFYSPNISHCLLLDEVFEASKLLGTIDPEDKVNETDLLVSAQRKILFAEVVYILGYGFDENNSERLQLANGLSPSRTQRIMFTNFGDSNRVNKKASRIFTGDFRTFLPPNSPLLSRPPGGYVEKSIGDVYKALDVDFDELEDR